MPNYIFKSVFKYKCGYYSHNEPAVHVKNWRQANKRSLFTIPKLKISTTVNMIP
jgi:hypothetical protein